MNEVEKVVYDINKIVVQNYYLKVIKYKWRCVNCIYCNICIKQQVILGVNLF